MVQRNCHSVMDFGRSLLCFIICVLLLLWNCQASAINEEPPQENTSRRTVYVAYPIQFGFSQRDEEGIYSGYTYDYLMRLSQSMDWEVEFVPFELTALMDVLAKLEEGEIQLSGAMVYSEASAEKYEFTSIPYGYTEFTLMALEEHPWLNRRSVFGESELRVALIEAASGENKLFDDYCKGRAIEYTPVYGKNNAACMELVENGLADAWISKNVVEHDGGKQVFSFGTQPFYFATTKGETKLIEDLNRAIEDISVNSPNYQSELSQKYFKKASDFTLNLTRDEVAFLKESPVVRVAVLANQPPLQSYDVKTGEFSGILVDLLKHIEAICGLSIEFVSTESFREAKQLLAQGAVELIAGVPYSFSWAAEEEILLTSSILSVPTVQVTNHFSTSSSEYLVSNEIANLYRGENLRLMSDGHAMLSLVKKGIYAGAYMNGYSAQYYMKEGGYQDLFSNMMPNRNYDISLGVSKTCDTRIIRILEQALFAISPTQREEIVYQNTSIIHEPNLMAMLRNNPLESIILTLTVSAILLSLLLLLFLRTKRLNRMIYLEKVKYEQISQLDKLTHAYNNISFKALVTHYLEEDISPVGALLVCDIDNFKTVNDTYGHLKGDDVIAGLGQLMLDVVETYGLVGRIGGDEMAILIKNIDDKATIEAYCARLIAGSRDLEKALHLTLSIGAVTFRKKCSYQDLFEQADRALYQVKAHGKNGYKVL